MHRFAWIIAALTIGAGGSAWADSPAEPSAEDRSAEIPNLNITADTIDYEAQRSVFVARGNAHVSQDGRTLSADWMTFSSLTRHGIAAGNVVLVDGDDVLHASFIEFNIDSLEGLVFDGRIVSGTTGFRLDGAEIRKTGASTYEFEDGTFTTCQCPEEDETDPWTIHADQADLEVGGYAVARNTSFEILGVPVIWLPWMIYPLKTERQSGFLFPEFSIGKFTGGDFGLPFFWAARENINVILTPTYLSKRGFMPKAEVEYVFGERSGGEAFGMWIHDKDINPDNPSTPFDKDRWGVLWEHDQFLPSDMRLKVDAVAISDNEVPNDFSDFSEFRRDRHLQSVGFLTKHFGAENPYGAWGSVEWAEDLQNPDNLDRDSILLQRLPDLGLAQMSSPVFGTSRVLASFDVDYTYFWTKERANHKYPNAALVGDGIFLDTGIEALPDGNEPNSAGTVGPGDRSRDDFPNTGGPEIDAFFEEGEPVGDRGHRVLVNPRLAVPFQLGNAIELFPEVGYHGTFYSTRYQDFVERSLFTGRLDLRARLRKVVELPFGFGPALHLIEPKLSYLAVTKLHQSGNPLLVPRTAVPQDRVRQLTVENILRDPADRIGRINGVVAGFSNRIFAEPNDARGGVQRLIADFSTSVEYQASGGKFGQVVTDGWLYAKPNTALHLIAGYDLDDMVFKEGLWEYGWRSPKGHDLNFRYRYIRDIPRFFEDFKFDDERFKEFKQGYNRVNEFGFTGRWAITARWAVTTSISYAFEKSILLASRGGVEYISKCGCWAIRAEIEDDRNRGYQFAIAYRLMGLGDDRIRPFEGDRSGVGSWGLAP